MSLSHGKKCSCKLPCAHALMLLNCLGHASIPAHSPCPLQRQGTYLAACLLAQLPFDGLMELKIFNAVVNHGARPRLDPFEEFLAEPNLAGAERQAITRYSALMQRCWAADVAARPRLKEVRWGCVLCKGRRALLQEGMRVAGHASMGCASACAA